MAFPADPQGLTGAWKRAMRGKPLPGGGSAAGAYLHGLRKTVAGGEIGGTINQTVTESRRDEIPPSSFAEDGRAAWPGASSFIWITFITRLARRPVIFLHRGDPRGNHPPVSRWGEASLRRELVRLFSRKGSGLHSGRRGSALFSFVREILRRGRAPTQRFLFLREPFL